MDREQRETESQSVSEVAGEKWLVLLPNKWNPPRAIVYGWRYDPRELSQAAAAPVRDPRCRGATRVTDDA